MLEPPVCYLKWKMYEIKPCKNRILLQYVHSGIHESYTGCICMFHTAVQSDVWPRMMSLAVFVPSVAFVLGYLYVSL